MPGLSFGQTQIGQDLVGRQANENFGQIVKLSSDGQRILTGGIARRIDPRVSKLGVQEYTQGQWNDIGPEDVYGYEADLSGAGDIIVTMLGHDERGIMGLQAYQLQSDGNWILDGQQFGGTGLYGTVKIAEGGKTIVQRTGDLNNNFFHVFRKDRGEWTQVGQTIKLSDQFAKDYEVSADGNTIVAIEADENTVPRYVSSYRYVNGSWIQVFRTYVDLRRGARHLAISPEGKRVVVADWFSVKTYNISFGNLTSVGEDFSYPSIFGLDLGSNGNALMLSDSRDAPEVNGFLLARWLCGNWVVVEDVSSTSPSDNSVNLSQVSVASRSSVCAQGTKFYDSNDLVNAGLVRSYLVQSLNRYQRRANPCEQVEVHVGIDSINIGPDFPEPLSDGRLFTKNSYDPVVIDKLDDADWEVEFESEPQRQPFISRSTQEFAQSAMFSERVEVYPNPVLGNSVSLNIPSSISNQPIYLLSNSGSQLRKFPAGSPSILLEGLLPGSYILRVGGQVLRLIIQ